MQLSEVSVMKFLTPLLPLLFATLLPAQAPTPQPPTAPVTTQVMAILTVKPGTARDQMMKVMQDEVRDTVRLHLDGKIQQWYARSDGKGVVFILNCTQVSEAKALLDKLPLIQNNFAEFEYMGLGPLTPLRILLGPPTP
jgi:hypothetical protein